MHLEPPLSGPRVEDCEDLRDNLVFRHEVTKVHSAWRDLKVGGGWEAGGWKKKGRERRRQRKKEGGEKRRGEKLEGEEGKKKEVSEGNWFTNEM